LLRLNAVVGVQGKVNDAGELTSVGITCALRSLNISSEPIVIPPIYGLKGVGFETFTVDGTITYWNSYVDVGQMGARAALAILASGSSSRRDARTSEEQLRSGGSEKGPAAIPQRGEMGDVPPVAECYGRTERPLSGKAIPA
jgi:hypothetical protein